MSANACPSLTSCRVATNGSAVPVQADRRPLPARPPGSAPRGQRPVDGPGRGLAAPSLSVLGWRVLGLGRGSSHPRCQTTGEASMAARCARPMSSRQLDRPAGRDESATEPHVDDVDTTPTVVWTPPWDRQAMGDSRRRGRGRWPSITRLPVKPRAIPRTGGAGEAPQRGRPPISASAGSCDRIPSKAYSAPATAEAVGTSTASPMPLAP